MVVELVTTQFTSEMPVGSVPNSAIAPFEKLVPVIVTESPPAVKPLVGEMLVTVGADRPVMPVDTETSRLHDPTAGHVGAGVIAACRLRRHSSPWRYHQTYLCPGSSDLSVCRLTKIDWPRCPTDNEARSRSRYRTAAGGRVVKTGIPDPIVYRYCTASPVKRVFENTHIRRPIAA